MQPTDPPPVFVDPQRRARLESAFPAIDAYLQQTVARDRLVGLAAGIVIDGELAWFRGYGHRDPARGLAVERDTRFGIGSITKTLTTLAVLQLRDEGRLDLDRPAHTYLPALAAIAYPSADSPPITVRQLITHTSGLPRMGNFPEYPETSPTRAEFLATLEGLGLDRPPGTRRVYSNLGFQLLGPLITEVTGAPHRDHIRDAILIPIGMQQTAWTPEDIPADKLAVGHERLPGQAPRARPHWRPGAADAAGGLYSSIDDLARFAAYNLDAWPARDEPEAGPLRRSTLREAHTLSALTGFWAHPGPGASALAGISGTGLGFGIAANCRHDHIVGHAGKTLNYRANLFMLPNRGVAVILLSNLSSTHSSVLPNDGFKILDILADTGALEPRRHAPSPALLDAAAGLAALLTRWDDDAHARLFSADYKDAYPIATTIAKLDEWRSLVGACRAPRPLTIDDPRAGSFELTCERGAVQIELRVAPYTDNPITSFAIHQATGLPVPPALTRAAERSLQLLQRWSEPNFRKLFAEHFIASEMRDASAEAPKIWGRCRPGQPRLHGARAASFPLTCERGSPTLKLRLSATDPAQIVEFDLREPRDGPCR